MRIQIAAILVAALTTMSGMDWVYAEGEKGGQGGSSSGGSDSGTSPGSGSSSGGSNSSDNSRPFEPMSVGDWDGGAYRNSSGNIYCELSDDYGNGVSLLVGWDQYGFYVLIVDPNTLKMEPWADFETMVSVDEFYRGKVNAFSNDSDQLELDFGDDRKAVSALRKGEKLMLEEWDHWYTLHGTGAAIAAVEDCYKRYR